MAAQKGDFTEALNLIEKRIRDRLESKTQYGDDKKKAALLQKLFARVDVDGSGTVGRSEFEAMMVQELNLVGQHKLLMRLFDRYDEDASEEIEYDEFVEGCVFFFFSSPHFSSVCLDFQHGFGFASTPLYSCCCLQTCAYKLASYRKVCWVSLQG